MVLTVTAPLNGASDINAICDEETGVNGSHTITIAGTATAADVIAVDIVVTGANPQATTLGAVTAGGGTWTVDFTYPSDGAGVASGVRPNKGMDTITINVTNETTEEEATEIVVTKCWEKALVYQQADGTWSTTPQDEDQDPGCASNTVGQGRGIVTPHKDIVVLYPEYVIEFVDALIASGQAKASVLATACGMSMASLAQGVVLKKNYHGITTPDGYTCNAGLVPITDGEYINDVVIDTDTEDPDDDEVTPGTVGYSNWFMIDDVCCVIGAVIDTIIWYPCSGYNAQVCDYLFVLDSAGNAMLKWPLASNNPQLRVPLLLRGHEITQTPDPDTVTAGGTYEECIYGRYRFKIKLGVPVCREHVFRIEWAGIKIVTVESQLSACTTETKQTQQGDNGEEELCHELS